MHIELALKVIEEGNPDDPVWLVGPSPLDALVLTGPLTQDRLEDLQLLSFATAVNFAASYGYPIEIAKGTDPPDRVVTFDGVDQGVELTELTVTDTRVELSQARQFGRQIASELIRDKSNFSHLLGRKVAVAITFGKGDVSLRKATPVSEIMKALLEDRGFVGEGVDTSVNFPDRWPNNRGFYGQVGNALLMVYPDGVSNEITVTCTCPARISLSETLRVITERVEKKDLPTNKVLLITCGMPDKAGYMCPIDSFMFSIVQKNSALVSIRPKHLHGVFLHQWGTLEWVELFRRGHNSTTWPPTIS